MCLSHEFNIRTYLISFSLTFSHSKWCHKRILGENHIDTLNSLHNFALTLRDQGHRERAFTLLTECLEKRRLAIGEDHPNTLKTARLLDEMRFAGIDLERRGSCGKEVESERERRKRDPCVAAMALELGRNERSLTRSFRLSLPRDYL